MASPLHPQPGSTVMRKPPAPHRSVQRRRLLLAALCVLLPPLTTRGYRLLDIANVNAALLTHSIRHQFDMLFPFFNLLALALLLAAVLNGRRVARAFAGFIALAYTLSAFLQNLSVTDTYGLGLTTSTFALTLLVAFAWLREAAHPQNNVSNEPRPRRVLLLLPFALLALWFPVDPVTFQPDFNLGTLLTSGASLSFCMLTIVALAVLLMDVPRVNPMTLFTTSLAGLLIGIGNLWLEFLHMPELAWVGVLHIPLVALSAAGLIVSRRLLSYPEPKSP